LHDVALQQRAGVRLSLRVLSAVLAAGALLGCVAPNQGAPPEAPAAAVASQCRQWFARLDNAVDDAGVRDVEARRIAGFSYLRVSRFLASFRNRALADDAASAAWRQRLAALDARGRGYEIANLPQSSLALLGVSDRATAKAAANRCAAVLMALDASLPGRRQQLATLAVVPDDYADWERTLGLYPLVRIPFLQFAKGWQSEADGMFRKAALESIPPPDLRRYRPPQGGLSATQVTALFATVKRDALGIPVFPKRETEALLATFAPVFEIEQKGSYDRIGALRWAGGATPAVDAAQPTVYDRIAFTRYGDTSLVQLVYLIWFAERPPVGVIDPVAGTLDAVIFRVTLDSSGRPLVYDSIHGCGCYHMFFPTLRARALPAPDPNVEWAFIPRSAPDIEPPRRLAVRITSGSHYLTDLHADDGGAGPAYAMVDDGVLRILPVQGGSRSIFGPDGLVAGTERSERLVTWPLGIDSAGAMREWGHHATALVGRRQFDDADLIEKRFAIVAPPPAVAKSAQLQQ
jgi:hypothetical protein